MLGQYGDLKNFVALLYDTSLYIPYDEKLIILSPSGWTENDPSLMQSKLMDCFESTHQFCFLTYVLSIEFTGEVVEISDSSAFFLNMM